MALATQPFFEEISWFVRESMPTRRRSIREFAEQEIILPSGPFGGYRFNCTRQPYAGLYFDAIDSGIFNRFVSTGPIQSGKSLICYVIPICYHLFELNETVVMGVADFNMAMDKWQTDLLPVIMKSRYRDMMPSEGAGSRGGKVLRVDFKNGATLRIMSGGGDDKMISAFTTRIVAATEIDGWAGISKARKVADPITELENRTAAFDRRKRVYLECTLTDKKGRTYQEITNGTDSKIYLRCPHCGHYVRPEREHVIGWQDAKNEIEAYDNGRFACPSCAVTWSEEDRRRANLDGKLVHRGQEIGPDGEIVGPIPETRTLGFRWSAVNNLLLTSGEIAVKLWNASRMEDQQSAERQLCQNVFAIPYIPPQTDTTPLDVAAILQREGQFGRGIVPPDAECVTVGGDIGKYTNWWVAIAWLKGGAGRVIDYGALEVLSDQFGEEGAIVNSLRALREKMASGWRGVDGSTWMMSEAWIDSHYCTQAVYQFCRESGERWRPIMGWGGSKDIGQGRTYRAPDSVGAGVQSIGDRYHFAYQSSANIVLVHVDVDYWKTWVHRRFASPVDAPASMTLYRGDVNEHKRFALHVTAERQIEEFIAGHGMTIKWVRERPANHYLDCTTYAAACAHHRGIRLIDGNAGHKSTTLSKWFGKKG